MVDPAIDVGKCQFDELAESTAVNHLTVNLQFFGRDLKIGRGMETDAITCGRQDRGDSGAGRALARRAADMDDRKSILRVAEKRQESPQTRHPRLGVLANFRLIFTARRCRW